MCLYIIFCFCVYAFCLVFNIDFNIVIKTLGRILDTLFVVSISCNSSLVLWSTYFFIILPILCFCNVLLSCIKSYKYCIKKGFILSKYNVLCDLQNFFNNCKLNVFIYYNK